MVEIDGSYGEGGGQVLRTALTLAALTGQPTHIRNIRAGRRKPGLAAQHLTGVLALADLCSAEVRRAVLGSQELEFIPRRKPRPGCYQFDVTHATTGGSAGSVTLILQTLLLPLAAAGAGSQLTLRGGTHVPWSPPFEYIEQVYLPMLARLGLAASCRLDAYGFYPAGSGQLSAEVQGTAECDTGAMPNVTCLGLKPLVLTERGALRRVSGTALACNLPAHIAQRLANRAANVLRQAGLSAQITPRLARGVAPGAYLWLCAEYEQARAGFCALGEKGKPSDQVADEACQALLTHHALEAPLDPHLADQMLLPLALAAGRSEFHTSQITRHLLTNAYIIQQFIPVTIAISGTEGMPGRVVIQAQCAST